LWVWERVLFRGREVKGMTLTLRSKNILGPYLDRQAWGELTTETGVQSGGKIVHCASSSALPCPPLQSGHPWSTWRKRCSACRRHMRTV
jgi:hypothetical protein